MTSSQSIEEDERTDEAELFFSGSNCKCLQLERSVEDSSLQLLVLQDLVQARTLLP